MPKRNRDENVFAMSARGLVFITSCCGDANFWRPRTRPMVGLADRSGARDGSAPRWFDPGLWIQMAMGRTRRERDCIIDRQPREPRGLVVAAQLEPWNHDLRRRPAAGKRDSSVLFTGHESWIHRLAKSPMPTWNANLRAENLRRRGKPSLLACHIMSFWAA